MTIEDYRKMASTFAPSQLSDAIAKLCDVAEAARRLIAERSIWDTTTWDKATAVRKALNTLRGEAADG